ncbi:hypothetical protein DFJ73DRAFT_875423 [Zopfochytrium polystomum]|nr:hypothetical protein DFJ73DRAFT_875423 [Zopfochytrium polystomum]
MELTTDPLVEVAPGFYTIKTAFHVFNLINVGTQMSFLRLSTGKFLVVDTVDLTPEAAASVDKLTNNGDLIEAVIGSHPYHTMFFRAFQERYKGKGEYWGTKRHLRVCQGVEWTGDVTTVLKKWAPEVQMRVPAGADFDDPKPDYNHFAGLFVFHAPSKTLHVDDTLALGDNPGFLQRALLGSKHGEVAFHPTLTGPGIRNEPGAPEQFRCFIEAVCDDWGFENLAAAHKGVLKGGAKQKVREALERALPTLQKMGANRAGIKAGEELEEYKKMWVPGGNHECG